MIQSDSLKLNLDPKGVFSDDQIREAIKASSFDKHIKSEANLDLNLEDLAGELSHGQE